MPPASPHRLGEYSGIRFMDRASVLPALRLFPPRQQSEIRWHSCCYYFLQEPRPGTRMRKTTFLKSEETHLFKRICHADVLCICSQIFGRGHYHKFNNFFVSKGLREETLRKQTHSTTESVRHVPDTPTAGLTGCT